MLRNDVVVSKGASCVERYLLIPWKTVFICFASARKLKAWSKSHRTRGAIQSPAARLSYWIFANTPLGQPFLATGKEA
jgi:hypothetical protein